MKLKAHYAPNIWWNNDIFLKLSIQQVNSIVGLVVAIKMLKYTFKILLHNSPTKIISK